MKPVHGLDLVSAGHPRLQDKELIEVSNKLRQVLGYRVEKIPWTIKNLLHTLRYSLRLSTY